MRLLLTDRFCDRAKPKGSEPQTDYFDETVSGLALRVAVSGRKTWTLHFTAPNSAKRTRLTLGTYPGHHLDRLEPKPSKRRPKLKMAVIPVPLER
jgi:Arm DNA-binding domain